MRKLLYYHINFDLIFSQEPHGWVVDLVNKVYILYYYFGFEILVPFSNVIPDSWVF